MRYVARVPWARVAVVVLTGCLVQRQLRVAELEARLPPRPTRPIAVADDGETELWLGRVSR